VNRRSVFSPRRAIAALSLFALVTVNASAFSGKASTLVPVVEWKGDIEQIFFHPLIVNPKLAFRGDSYSQQMNLWFVTVDECKTILEDFYKRNYVLVDMTDLYDVGKSGAQLNVKKKKLFLPQGKKPLVISLDDVNYYPYMRNHGTAVRMDVDDQGRPTAVVLDSKGKESFSREGDAVPLIDDFVEAHPDFSWHGAKGIVALTGYQGVLGYQTQRKGSKTYDKDVAKVKEVVAALKRDNWRIASHGYAHLDAIGTSQARLDIDTDRWLRDVGSLVGSTPLYIFPFGSSVLPGSPKFAMFEKKGFTIFFGVSNRMRERSSAHYATYERLPIDGRFLAGQYGNMKPYLDLPFPKEPLRPAMGGGKAKVRKQ
jgi:hypothetical protein